MESSVACKSWLLEDLSEKQVLEALAEEDESSSSDNNDSDDAESLVRNSGSVCFLFVI